MRAPATLLKAGVSAAAALLLMTACGGSDDEQSDASSGSSSSGSAGSSSSADASASSSDEDVQAFCTEAETVFTQISDGLDAATPTDLVPALDQAVSAFDQLEPPAEISADWSTAQSAFVSLREAVAGADLTTPEGQTAVQEAVTGLEAQAGDAQTNIDAWVTENCDNA